MLIQWLPSTGNTKIFPPFTGSEEQSSTASAAKAGRYIPENDSGERREDVRFKSSHRLNNLQGDVSFETFEHPKKKQDNVR